ncbi:MAG: glycerol-3-phosphate 1-O-acyltransferase PlsY [Bacilli bacterium]
MTTTILRITFLLLPLIVGYFLGSLNNAIIIGKVFFKKDPRDYGSKNSGGTNAGRVFGYKIGLLVIILDIIKTFAPMICIYFIYKNTICLEAEARFVDFDQYAIYLAGIGSTLGHCFPIYYGFKGGKAVSTLGGICLFTSWFVSIIGLFVFFLFLKIKKYVSLSSISASISVVLASIIAIFLPVGMNFGIKANWMYSLFLGIIAVLLIIRHIPNIKRLKNHTESKIKWMK